MSADTHIKFPASPAELPSPPRAEKHPHQLTDPGGEIRQDPYYWLNQRGKQEVIDYLEQENQYTDTVLAPLADLRARLFEEMKGRIKEDDITVPYKKGSYWYYTRFVKGYEYPLFCRRKDVMENPEEEVILDVNDLARGYEFCQLGSVQVSPDHEYLAYSVDYTGRYLYTMYIKHIPSGRLFEDTIEMAGAIEWGNDSKTIYYDTKDPVTLRNDRIWRHTLGNRATPDELLFHEPDETLYVYLNKSKSDKYIFVSVGYVQTEEVRFLRADDPHAALQVFQPRDPKRELYYSVEHWEDRFLVRTNYQARNFRVMSTPLTATGLENWQELVPHRPSVLIEDMTVFASHLVTLERKGGLKNLHLIRMSDHSEHYLETGEPTYEVNLDNNPDYYSKVLRYSFSSLKTPYTVLDYNMDTREKTVKKVSPVLGGFESEQYQTEFKWVTARDGVQVPVSLVYRKGVRRDGSAPCLLVGYGSYGYSYDPAFNREVVSLLDRGFVYAIAHIRGGMELGYEWYENGKMLRKMNTFTDFIDCASALCADKYTASDRLFASGRSAGGLLMGVVTNLRPDLFKGIITGVPFLDVLTTMSDPSIPLTTGEYTEWGNPATPEQYAYMRRYSPYDNLEAKQYPNILVLTSLADSQVQYFEPAKYVARLRDLKTDHNLLLLKTNMTGSHGGSSGRFERLKERALEYAWMLGLVGG